MSLLWRHEETTVLFETIGSVRCYFSDFGVVLGGVTLLLTTCGSGGGDI